MLSLKKRSFIAASLILTAFLGLTGYALDNAFRNSAKESAYQRMEARIYGLLAVAELDEHGLIKMPAILPDERFMLPGSGYYAQINDQRHETVWRSKSQLGYTLPEIKPQPANLWLFEQSKNNQGDTFYRISFGVSWEIELKNNEIQTIPLTFSIFESTQFYQSQVEIFQHSLWGWLVLVGLLLLIAQIGILQWSLSPLHQVEDDLNKIETGEQEILTGQYPRELSGLTNNLNNLLNTQSQQLKRYRNSLADLAHSLKTPLAILKGESELHRNDVLSKTVQEQQQRMLQIVDYQLQHAALSGRTALMQTLSISEIINRIVTSMKKVYADKKICFELDIPGELEYKADEGDLMELFGNIIDNACKWSQSSILIKGFLTHKNEQSFLSLIFEDDGQGIPEEEVSRVLTRGVRADCNVKGHGIGLAIVSNIIDAYEGKLNIGSLPTGGTRIEIDLKI